MAVAVAALVVAANASSGAYFSQSWGWVALAFLVPTTLLIILDRVRVPGRLRVALVALMGGLAVWIALSSIWSLSPSASGREAERMLVYVAIALAVALVLRRGDAAGVYCGAAVGVVAVASYGLATRLFPDRFGFDDDSFNAYRLAEPLGYWNSFGLLAALAAILAVGVVAHTRRSSLAFVAGATVPLSTAALYFTFSRGSWMALGFGAATTIALDPRRIRTLWSLLAVGPVAIVGVIYASRQDALTTADSPLAIATQQGHRVAWVLAALVVLAGALGWLAHRIAGSVPLRRRERRIADVALAIAVCSAVVVALVAVGGPAAGISKLRDRFEAAPTAAGPDLNDRLFSISSNGRTETLGLAWDVGMEHPVGGRGAGTYEYVWYERRPSGQIVRDAHSLYAETFSELGIVGLFLLAAALTVPIVAAVRARRTRFVAPAFGAYATWAAAASLDWHWEMVGLTTTALLVGSVGLLAAERRSGGALDAGSRLALVGVTGTLSVLAVWSLVGNQALFAAREAVTRRDWSEARDDARRAQALLFWSHEPELVLGDVAAGTGDRAGALAVYRDAVAEDPRNWVAWLHVAQVARGAERAAAYDRVHELNPREEGLPGE
ncbi:MAG TPA: O-antigen ligase family protein [Gaiellaceae bacterium]|nr:O-antigen ligase family protein [Gaiellaceae bacterium]